MNQKLIEQVASLSKHPHAALIVEWLITGCEVEYYSDMHKEWRQTNDPYWGEHTTYRLVKPKPACRLYLSKVTGNTFTRDSKTEPRDNKLPSGYIWISDWIELPTWPTSLVARIAAIDIDAANWIVENWHNGNLSKNATRLDAMFTWCKAPQGDEYWSNISHKLGE